MLLVQTPLIKKAIEKYKDRDTEYVEDIGTESIPHGILVHIAKQLGGEYALSKLVKGTSVYIAPKPKPAPKPKEYVEMMKRLDVQYQEAEYKRMLNLEASPDGSEDITPSMMIKQTREQLSAIANVIISVFSVAWAMWYWSGSSGYSIATRTLLSVFGGIGILVAEVVVYMGYKNKVQDAKKTERKKVEKTKIIKTYEIRASKPVKVVDHSEEKTGATSVASTDKSHMRLRTGK